MMDVLYISVVLVFFLLTWGLTVLCERLGLERSGEKP
jgi:hypothetical protein